MTHIVVLCTFLLISTFGTWAWLHQRIKQSHRSIPKLNLNFPPTTDNKFEKPRKIGRLGPLRFKVSEATDVADTDDDFEEVNFGKHVGSKPKSSFAKKISSGFVPVAASIGFALTPSPTIAARIAGAAAGGVFGLVAKTLVSSKTETEDDYDDAGSGDSGISLSLQVKAAIKALSGGPPTSSLTMQQLEKVAKKLQVPDSELGIFFTNAFAEAVYDATQNSADIMELNDVIEFAADVGFTPAEIGDGFSVAAIRLEKLLERNEDGFYSTSDHELLEQAAKIFFLADKMLEKLDGFYGTRFITALCFFTEDKFKERITSACTSLFKKCIEQVLLNPDAFEPTEVANVKAFLSTGPAVSDFRPAQMQNMIMESLKFQLDQALGPEDALNGNTDINAEALQKAKRVLGWNNYEFDATIETRTMPVFESLVEQLVTEVLENPNKSTELSETLTRNIKSLNIDAQRARSRLISVISEKNKEYMESINKVYSVSGNNVIPAYKIMTSYSKAHDALQSMCAPVMGGIKIPVPGLPFAEMVRAAMFEIQISKGAKSSVSDDMFSLSPEQQQVVRKSLALPKVSAWILQCLREGNFASGAKDAYRKQLDQFGVSSEEWAATGIDFYYEEVQQIASSRQIPSAPDMLRLSNVSSFLDCPAENVALVNLELFGGKYVKALSEAMNPTGVISEEYIDGLERLRLRLGLTEADAQNLLGVAARTRLSPVVKDLVDVWKSESDGEKRQEQAKDLQRKKGGDPISSMDNVLGYMETGGQKEGGGPNVFMREALNLVDFFTENYLSQGQSLAAIETLPVTAVGVVPEQDLIGSFKYYLLTRLSEEDPDLRARYQRDERIFALVLGIAPESQARVKESLAYTAYKNMLKNILRTKEGVDAQDLQQFGMLKSSLGLDQASADKVYEEASRGAVVEHAAGVFRVGNDVQITPEMARLLRKQVISMGLEIKKDAGFNDKLVTFLYALEVQYMVENGLEEELQEAQEAYDIPEERAAEIIDACCQRYISQLLNLALRDAKKYNEAGAFEYTSQIMKYAQYISGAVDADGNVFREEDKTRMLSFYEARLLEDVPSADEEGIARVSEGIAKLRSLVNLTESYVAPIDGIDGLLGKLSGMQTVGEDGKKWAWGS